MVTVDEKIFGECGPVVWSIKICRGIVQRAKSSLHFLAMKETVSIGPVVVVDTDVENEYSFQKAGDHPVDTLLLDVIDGVAPIPLNMIYVDDDQAIVQDKLGELAQDHPRRGLDSRSERRQSLRKHPRAK